MVAQLIFLFFLCPLVLFSGEFTASVNHNQIDWGESVVLHLTLKEASARAAPSLSALRKNFLINSQQQSSNTVVVNGQATTSTSWRLTLVPQGEGQWEIPSVSIDTTDGTLFTDPITIQVIKGISREGSESSEMEGIDLTAEISNHKPYKNEPFIYTVKLSSKRNLANLQMQKVHVEDAIVEVNGEPKIYDKVVRGVRLDIIEFSYLITPLKAGTLKIPPAALQGGIPMKRRGQGGSIFDNNLDPISIMQGFDRLQPFSITTEEVNLDVQPAVSGINPWLPARSLRVEEIWNDAQSLQEGEPLTRSFKIIAEGAKASQLPSLNDLQIDHSLFKIYADKPEMGEEVKDGQVKSYRKEQYTLIPQQSGELTLPEISITWWDVSNEEKRVTKIPAKAIYVAPGILNHKKTEILQEAPVVLEPQIVTAPRSPVLYIVIAGLAILLVAAIFFGIALQQKISRLTAGPLDKKHLEKSEKPLKARKVKKKISKSDKKEKLPDLNPT